MGTRADFYVGRGKQAEWLGSIGWDGSPDSIPSKILKAKTEKAYRVAVDTFLKAESSATVPSDGWPWPWDDSRTTDYSYAFDGTMVYASSFGSEWWKATQKQPDRELPTTAVFPDMSKIKNVAWDSKRSGLIIITGK